ncbi:hypothetical protein N644_1017 [Lactiplantibacillus paraplantarum]|nr:hypothetical protein N644_1017 [Lactiplantibacillus paraplantarum]
MNGSFDTTAGYHHRCQRIMVTNCDLTGFLSLKSVASR